jgi:hypothetical protein
MGSKHSDRFQQPTIDQEPSFRHGDPIHGQPMNSLEYQPSWKNNDFVDWCGTRTMVSYWSPLPCPGERENE